MQTPSVFLSPLPTLAALVFWQSLATFANAAVPELPRESLDVSLPVSSGQVIGVPAGGDLQAALDQAQPGDIIELAANATYSGNFRLPAKTGTGWIIVRSSAEALLPPSGTRVTPADDGWMPKIVSPNTSAALATDFAAHHFRFIGIEITTAHATTSATNYALVLFGYDRLGYAASSLEELPTDIIFDRCYLHGTPTGNVRRAITMNARRVAVVDSHISDIHEVGADSQAIGGWNGPGPFLIENNYLEAAGENVMFGGATPSITGLVPSDIEIVRNHFSKPLDWRVEDPSYGGIPWSVKNLFELKNAQRVRVEGNVLQQNWAHAQNGFAILFTPRKEGCAADWAVVEDITFANNVVRNVAAGVNMLGIDGGCVAAGNALRRIAVRNNIFQEVDGAVWGGNGALFQLLSHVEDVTIDHNTAFHTGSVIIAAGEPSVSFTYTNNLSAHNSYGVTGDNLGIGDAVLDYYFPGHVFRRNLLAGPWPTPGGATESDYNGVPDNFLPDSIDDAQFVDRAAGKHRLADSSPYKNAATDGTDVGTNFDQLDSATEGPTDTIPPNETTPTPAPDPDPSVTIDSPTHGTVVSGIASVEISPSTDAEVLEFHVNGRLVAGYAPPPGKIDWDSTSVADGDNWLSVRVYDAASNASDAAVSVMVKNQPEPTPTPEPTPEPETDGPPVVSIVDPADGSRMRHPLKISVAASDDRGLVSISVYGDDSYVGNVGCSGTACSGRVTWPNNKLPTGGHLVTAVATDTAGHSVESNVTVYK